MKNAFYLILFSFLFTGLTNSVLAQSKESAKQQKFVTQFMGAVRMHKKGKIIKKIEKTYLAKSLDKEFKGDKDAFLSHFFAGNIVKKNELSKVPLNKIFDIRMQELNDLQAGLSECKFILSTPEGDVETVLYLKMIKKGKYAFEPTRK